MSRPRRSSRLGGEPRGATGGPAFATVAVRSMPAGSPRAFGISFKASKRRRNLSSWQQYYDYAIRYTWLTPLTLVLIVILGYSIDPNPSNPLRAAIFLSYPLSKTGPKGATMYGKGAKDLAFVAFYTIVLSFLREFCMQCVLNPLGLYLGIRSRRKMARFMEQMYTVMYFSILIPFGLYVMSRSPVWYFNTTAMFEGFPHREHEGLFKAYYLIQASYWSQQALVLVLQLERPRTDFYEFAAHHVVTLALIWSSYRFHFTYMGLAVYITHDISDFGLATSRVLNYLNSVFTDAYYVLFILVWIYTRHYLNLHILWAVLTEFATVGPYELNWETQQYKCWISQIITFSLLACLQALNIFWLFLILRVLWNYIMTRNLVDETSDVEDEQADHESRDQVMQLSVQDTKEKR